MSFVDDLVNNAQNAIEDARKIGQTLAPPTSAPIYAPEPVKPETGERPYIAYGIAALVVAIVIWRVIK